MNVHSGNKTAEVQPARLRKPHAPSSTGTLGKAVSLLDIVAGSGRPMRFTEILALSDQPRGTLHRQLTNLLEEGFLSVNSDHTYELGFRLLRLASAAWANNRFRIAAEPHLHRLHELTGETVHLGVLKGTDVICLDKVEGRHSVRSYSQIGDTSPACCSGVGMAAMAGLADDVLDALMQQMNFQHFTGSSPHTPDALRQNINAIRKSGCAFDWQGRAPGVCSVAAPVHSPDRRFLAGISVDGPAFRATQDALEGWAVLVSEAARAITDDMSTRLEPPTLTRDPKSGRRN
ncbi:IclR family transcriptional regulator [Hoeflea sp. TYP-13]|uniref:IclR family transcriptional regulator n=1 Tax=Hoeflea sp. TYP-13 TaxID=3230023 RepID=UPI0034C5E2A6